MYIQKKKKREDSRGCFYLFYMRKRLTVTSASECMTLYQQIV